MVNIKNMAAGTSLKQVTGQNCGRNCLGTCCIAGAKLPLYSFQRRDSLQKSHGDDHGSGSSVSGPTLLDSLILSKWEDKASRGLFRYDVTSCETKMLDGECGFVAQLNEGRHSKKRPTEFRIDQVLQPFDMAKFNFSKVGQEEVIFRFEEGTDGVSEYHEHAILEGGSPNIVAINVSPIEYGHVLLVPRVMDCIPQRIDMDTFLLALHMAAEVNSPYFRLGYNSLGAFATINHLHFQAYYLYAPFAMERAPTNIVAYGRREGGVRISQLSKYPVRGLVYEGGSSLHELAEVVSKACVLLQDSNIPYNILIADSGSRVFLLPQCFAERQARGDVDRVVLDTQVNPAVWEMSGHIVLKRKEDYEIATEDYAWKLLAEASLSEERFEVVKETCLKAAEENLRPWHTPHNFDEIITVEDDVGKAPQRTLSARFKTKVRKGLDLETLCQECIFPRA